MLASITSPLYSGTMDVLLCFVFVRCKQTFLWHCAIFCSKKWSLSPFLNKSVFCTLTYIVVIFLKKACSSMIQENRSSIKTTASYEPYLIPPCVVISNTMPPLPLLKFSFGTLGSGSTLKHSFKWFYHMWGLPYALLTPHHSGNTTKNVVSTSFRWIQVLSKVIPLRILDETALVTHNLANVFTLSSPLFTSYRPPVFRSPWHLSTHCKCEICFYSCSDLFRPPCL